MVKKSSTASGTPLRNYSATVVTLEEKGFSFKQEHEKWHKKNLVRRIDIFFLPNFIQDVFIPT